MSGIASQNPFAPPRALVDDRIDTQVEMVPATRGSRFAAAIIDLLAILGVVAVSGIVVAITLPAYAAYQKRALGVGMHPADPGPVFLVVGLLVVGGMLCVGLYSGMLVYRYGQTIGKRAMNIRVVRTDGARVAFGRFIFLRWLPVMLLGMIPFVGYLISLVDSLLIFRDNRLCVHDNIADTKVVTSATSEGATLAGSSGAHVRTVRF